MKKDDNAEKLFVYVIPGFKNRKGIEHFEYLTRILRKICFIYRILQKLNNYFFVFPDAPWAHQLKNAIINRYDVLAATQHEGGMLE